MKSLSLIVGVAASALAFSPLPNQYKAVTSLTGAVVCGQLAIADGITRRKRLETQDKRQQDLEFRCLDLENLRSAFEDDLTSLEQLRTELTLERDNLAAILRATEDSAIAELEAKESQTNADIQSSRRLAAKRIKAAKAKHWQIRNASKQETEAMLMSALEDLTAQATRLKSNSKAYLEEKARSLIAAETTASQDATNLLKELVLSAQESLKEEAAQHNKDNQEDLEQGIRQLEKVISTNHKQSLGEAKALADQAIALLAADLELMEISHDEILEENEKLRGELDAIAKPLYCPYANRAGEKANEFIRFVNESMKVKLTWISSIFLTGDCLQVDFGFHDSEDKTKAIAKLQKPQAIEAIAVRFGNEGVIIQANPVDHCWRATIPANEGYQGSDDAYQLPSTREADDIESALRSQLDFAGMEGYMKNFVPTPINVANLGKEPSQQELTTINYFMFWKLAATDTANIVSIPGLLKAVYGVDEVTGKAKNPRLGESLWDRLNRLQPQLRKDYGYLILGERPNA